jgi:hypothetical protein
VRVDEMEAAGWLRVHQCKARGWDLGQKFENRASVAWFGACCVKWQCGKIVRGSSDLSPGDLENGVGNGVVWGFWE